MKLSKRGLSIPPSPIRKLAPSAEAAKREGVEIYHLNIGQPDLPTPAGFWEAIHGHTDRVLAYGHSAGILEFREGLAGYYRRCGYAGIESDHITVTTGGSEAILFALLACCDPGDEVLCFEPFYTNYNGFAHAASVRLVPIRCEAEGGYRLPLDAVLGHIGPRTRAILACTPNNPTGTVLSRAEMLAIAELCRRHELFFLCDEVYREFVYEEPHVGVLSLGIDEHAVMLDSVSKRFSACGARIGCAVTKNQALQRAFLHLGQARLCPPTLEQHGALALVDLKAEYYEEIQHEYRLRRDVVVEALRSIPGVVCGTPLGAFYVMAKLPIDDGDRFARWLLTSFRHAGATVMLAPGSGFYATEGLGRDEVRIAYVLEVDRLKRAMECLREGLRQYPGRVQAL